MFWVEGTRFDPEHDESETFIACSLKQEAKSRILENPDGEMGFFSQRVEGIRRDLNLMKGLGFCKICEGFYKLKRREA